MFSVDANHRSRPRPFWQATRTPEHELGPVASWRAVAGGVVQPQTWAWIALGIGAAFGLERLTGTGAFLWWGAVVLWFAAGLPILMSGLIALACGALLAALAPLAWVASRCTGRPSGYRSLSSELRALAWSVLPRYLRALRRVQKPQAWAMALGAIAWWCGRAAWLCV